MRIAAVALVSVLSLGVALAAAGSRAAGLAQAPAVVPIARVQRWAAIRQRSATSAMRRRSWFSMWRRAAWAVRGAMPTR